MANQEKIPLYAVVGSKEVEGRSLSLNYRRGDGEGVMDLGAVGMEEVSWRHIDADAEAEAVAEAEAGP